MKFPVFASLLFPSVSSTGVKRDTSFESDSRRTAINRRRVNERPFGPPSRRRHNLPAHACLLLLRFSVTNKHFKVGPTMRTRSKCQLRRRFNHASWSRRRRRRRRRTSRYVASACTRRQVQWVKNARAFGPSWFWQQWSSR